MTILRNRVGDEDGDVGCPDKGMFAKKRIDSCTNTFECTTIL